MNLTTAFIILVVAMIVIFDVYIIARKGGKESISAKIALAAYNYPSIPFAVGFVCGHFFWQMRGL